MKNDEHILSVQMEKQKKNKQECKIGNITKEQRRKFDELIKRNADIFVRDENDFGRIEIIKHTIDTGDEKPIKQRAYRAGLKDRERIKEEIDRLLEKGAIRKSNSLWASPVVIVPKKNGKRRVCIDYRKINRVTRYVRYISEVRMVYISRFSKRTLSSRNGREGY